MTAVRTAATAADSKAPHIGDDRPTMHDNGLAQPSSSEIAFVYTRDPANVHSPYGHDCGYHSLARVLMEGPGVPSVHAG